MRLGATHSHGGRLASSLTVAALQVGHDGHVVVAHKHAVEVGGVVGHGW